MSFADSSRAFLRPRARPSSSVRAARQALSHPVGSQPEKKNVSVFVGLGMESAPGSVARWLAPCVTFDRAVPRAMSSLSRCGAAAGQPLDDRGQIRQGVEWLQHRLDQAVVVDQHAVPPTKKLCACITLRLKTGSEPVSSTVFTAADSSDRAKTVARLAGHAPSPSLVRPSRTDRWPSP